MSKWNWGIAYYVKIDKGIKKWGTSWTKSLGSFLKGEYMVDVAKLYRYYINKKVPKKTGALRRSAKAKGLAGEQGTGFARIYWATEGSTEKYGHYQFVGDVYGPNKAVFKALGPNKGGGAGVQSGWVSPKGKKKYNTHRKMGVPFEYTLHDGRVVRVKGYTTPGTGYDWLKAFREDTGSYGERAINIMAGRYTYELFCMKTKYMKPVGGYQVYHHVKGIKNRTGG